MCKFDRPVEPWLPAGTRGLLMIRVDSGAAYRIVRRPRIQAADPVGVNDPRIARIAAIAPPF